MEKEELKANQDAQERRGKKKPSPKKNKLTLVPLYCKGCGLCVELPDRNPAALRRSEK